MKKNFCIQRPAAIIATLVAAMALGGCAPRYADTPTPTRFESSSQLKLQAADHWRIIADNFATQLTADLKAKGIEKPLYIPTAEYDYAFVEGFSELLTTSLLHQGWDMRTSDKHALKVDVRYSIYKFNPDRVNNTYFSGEATALTAGLWAVSGIVESGMATGGKALAVVMLAEGANWILNDAPNGPGKGQIARGPIPRSEILVTAAIHDGDQIVARRSNIYFAADEDTGLYWNKRNPNRSTAAEIRVRGE